MKAQAVCDRFAKFYLWRHVICLLFIFSYLFYLSWRITILNKDSLLLSSLYFLAECLGFFLAASAILKSWRHKYRKCKNVADDLLVDVLIPVYQEPIHIVRKTILAAKNIDYKHQTIILDDGKRDEVRQLAQEFSVKYYCREKNEHAKAGNLNFGLSKSRADFVMVFDADHIALPDCLHKMLGFFDDEKMAMVQAPQFFYNKESFQNMNGKDGAIWHDQSFYYNICQPCLDYYDKVSCVGSGVIYRRSSLDAIGGIPVETLTEDTHTSIRLHKWGYKTCYYNEPIAYGIGASDLQEFCKTRKRWAYGNIQIVKKEKVFFYKGFGLHEKLLNLTLFFDHLEGWQQFILLNIPIITLVFGFAPFEISIFNVLVTLFFPLFSFLMLQEIGCGFSKPSANEIFSMLRWPIYLDSVWAWFDKKIKWESSSKNIKGKVNLKYVRWQILLLFCGIFALIFSFFKLSKTGFETGPISLFLKKFFTGENVLDGSVDFHGVLQVGYTVDLVIIAGFWVLYNIFRVLFLLRKIYIDSAKSNEFYRFKSLLPVGINGVVNSFVKNISEDWIEFVNYNNFYKIGDFSQIDLYLPAKKLQLKVKIEKIADNFCGATVDFSCQKDRDDLCCAIYYIDWQRDLCRQDIDFFTPSRFILKILTLWYFRHKKQVDLSCFYYDGKPAVLATSKDENSVALFEERNFGDVVKGVKINKNVAKGVNLKIVSPSQRLIKGYDGKVVFKYLVEVF